MTSNVKPIESVEDWDAKIEKSEDMLLGAPIALRAAPRHRTRARGERDLDGARALHAGALLATRAAPRRSHTRTPRTLLPL